MVVTRRLSLPEAWCWRVRIVGCAAVWLSLWLPPAHANYSPRRAARDRSGDRRLVTTGSRGCPIVLGSLSILNRAERGKLTLNRADKLVIEVEPRVGTEMARVQIVDPGDGTVHLDRSFTIDRPALLEISLPPLLPDKEYLLNAGILCPSSIAASNLLSARLSVSDEIFNGTKPVNRTGISAIQ